ncbi:MAG TPA: hypothetical protein VMS37_24625 [Verrucomicrobiae bacterium]|nr:hypothetical protein [Verrucomicrobiae bacterium]
MRICAATIGFLAAALAAEAASITITNPSFETATLPYQAGNGSYNQLLLAAIPLARRVKGKNSRRSS